MDPTLYYQTRRFMQLQTVMIVSHRSPTNAMTMHCIITFVSRGLRMRKTQNRHVNFTRE